MKKDKRIYSVFKIITIMFLCLAVFGCNKKEVNEDLVIDEVLNNNYSGYLSVNFTNQMPQFAVEETMGVSINEFGLVNIDNGVLDYFGETMFSDDSKIERSGQWEISPTGILITEGGIDYVKIDAGIAVIYDIQKVYAKDNNDEWILVSEIPFSGEPNSDLNFGLDDAILEGATSGTQNQLGSIEWNLLLTVLK